MKQIPAGEFKARCLAIMDQVMQSGEPIVVTKHGKPVVKLVPAENRADDIFDYMAGKAKVVGDIVGPVTPLEDWKTNEGKPVILLDTHVLYWMANDSKRLSRRARETIREARQERHAGIVIATITVWELAWLAQNRRIELSVSVESFVRELVAR